MLERESLLHPVVEQGLAFPMREDGPCIGSPFAVGLSAAGIRWDSAKGMIVHAVVLLAVPLSEAQIYLALLGTLSRFTQDETAFASFKQSAQPEKMLAILNSFPLPESRSLKRAAAASAISGQDANATLIKASRRADPILAPRPRPAQSQVRPT